MQNEGLKPPSVPPPSPSASSPPRFPGVQFNLLPYYLSAWNRLHPLLATRLDDTCPYTLNTSDSLFFCSFFFVTLDYYTLYRFEIFSAPITIAHCSIGLPPRSLANAIDDHG